LLDTVHGDIVFDQQQAADIGNAMGNGAGSFTSPAAAGVIPMGESGNLSVITAQPGINPASTAADIVLAVFTLPAGGLDVANRMLEITANGATVANTNTKTMKMIMGAANPVVGQAVSGGTTIASITTASGGGGWSLSAEVVKFGAKGSNTQQAIHTAAQSGSVVGALQAPSALALNEAQLITIVVTGNAAATATDVTFNSLQVSGWN
jgi:hypothetical protein